MSTNLSFNNTHNGYRLVSIAFHWLTLSAKGEPIPFFGVELPALLSPDKALAKQIKEVQKTIATVGYAVIGQHAAAAIYHHYSMRDNTLRLMLPLQRP
jgi:cytochrome b561